MKSAALSLALIAVSAPASADLSVQFIEGAPKDRFVISSSAGTCADAPLTVTVDLNGSVGKLIFDVTGAGAGVEVFQPFELVAGGDRVTQTPSVLDGDRALTLSLSGLPAGTDVAFTIDVDDTIGAREITVTDAEIAGATVRVTAAGKTTEARFGGDAIATLDWTGCAF